MKMLCQGDKPNEIAAVSPLAWLIMHLWITDYLQIDLHETFRKVVGFRTRNSQLDFVIVCVWSQEF